MTPQLPTTVHFTIAAFNLKQDRALLYRKVKSIGGLQRLLDQAIHKGATVISIRRIHPTPKYRADHLPHPKPPETPPPEEGHQG